jgi:glutaredoxin
MHNIKPPLMPTLPLSLGLAALLYAASASAVTVVECMDAEGNSTFREHCPPGTVQKGEKKLPGNATSGGETEAPVDVKEVAAKHPVLLYVAPKCNACDLVRKQLQNRGVPFTEKDASNDIKVQDELKALIGGSTLTVPAVSVDKVTLTDYNQQALDSALDKAGYPPMNAPTTKTATEGGKPAPSSDTGTPPAPATDTGAAGEIPPLPANTAPPQTGY